MLTTGEGILPVPRTLSGDPWEQAIRSSVRGKPGFTISQARGRALLRYRPPEGKDDSCVLPLDWAKANTEKILLLSNRIAQMRLSGDQGTLKGALAAAQDSSTTMRRQVDWETVTESLRHSLQSGGNEINDKTWRYNYAIYIEHGIDLVNAGKVCDGYSLLRETLKQWEGKADSRIACCGALKALTKHGVARHGMARTWEVTSTDVKELKGKRPAKRIKATLTDAQILSMIESLEQRNPQWANVLRLMALYGLRPIELQHLQPKQREDGSLGMWCSYSKVCGATKTAPRWIEPCYLRDGFGEPVRWNLAAAMQAGLLDLPKGRDGELRKLEGKSVLRYLESMPEWKALDEKCEARGEWLRPYVYRDSYSLRAHQQGIEVGSVALSMGHSVAVHSSNYRWASAENTAAAFAAAFADAG